MGAGGPRLPASASRDGAVMKQLTGLLLLLFVAAVTAAEPVEVSPGALDQAITEASEGDVLMLEPGVHHGPFEIHASITLKGTRDAILDGGGEGTVLSLYEPDIRVRGLTLRNSGANLTDHDAAVLVAGEAAGSRIEDNRIHARGFGIWLDGTRDVRVQANQITGDAGIRSQDRGNGIHLFNVSGAQIINNRVCQTRDGIYIDVSNGNRLEGNELCDQRYGIHYMYSHDNEIVGNRTHGNRTGFALMQSRGLEVRENRSENDQGYGFLMNYLTHSRILNNRAIGVRASTSSGSGTAIQGGEGKGMFVYNAHQNKIRGNLVAQSDIGIHLTAGSENNELYGNAFISNRTQVMYVANREQEWSRDGRGNYWSDYMGWDMAGDGIGDTPYQPNDAIDRVLWKYPSARVLINSPAVQLLRWVQRAFPVLRPSGVTDSAPLMRPPQHLEDYP